MRRIILTLALLLLPTIAQADQPQSCVDAWVFAVLARNEADAARTNAVAAQATANEVRPYCTDEFFQGMGDMEMIDGVLFFSIGVSNKSQGDDEMSAGEDDATDAAGEEELGNQAGADVLWAQAEAHYDAAGYHYSTADSYFTLAITAFQAALGYYNMGIFV